MKDMFEETANRLFAQFVNPEMTAAAESGAWPPDLWSAIEENGLTLAAVPEELGGVGGQIHDAYGVVTAAGRHAVPAPLVEALLANWLLGIGGIAPEGMTTLALTRGTLSHGRFSGTLREVPWGSQTSHILVAGDEGAVLLVDAADGAIVEKGFNLAREPRDTLQFSDAATRLVEGVSADAVRLAAVSARAAQVAGALDSLVESAIDYANQREQFGRPIGKFQAIQHQIAILATKAATTGCAAETAFAEAAPKGFRPQSAVAAKVIASETAGQGAAIAHAVLGAIGFTYEHSLQFTTRRLWAWRSEFGNEPAWSARLGVAACRLGSGKLWPAITAGTVLG